MSPAVLDRNEIKATRSSMIAASRAISSQAYAIDGMAAQHVDPFAQLNDALAQVGLMLRQMERMDLKLFAASTSPNSTDHDRMNYERHSHFVRKLLGEMHPVLARTIEAAKKNCYFSRPGSFVLADAEGLVSEIGWILDSSGMMKGRLPSAAEVIDEYNAGGAVPLTTEE